MFSSSESVRKFIFIFYLFVSFESPFKTLSWFLIIPFFKHFYGNGNPLQYSYLENSMDRAAWWAIVQGVAKSQTQLSVTATHG